MKVQVDPYRPGDAEELIRRGFRPCDTREAWKAAALDAPAALRRTLALSDMAASIRCSGSVCRDTASGLFCAPGRDQKSPAPSPKTSPSLSDGKPLPLPTADGPLSAPEPPRVVAILGVGAHSLLSGVGMPWLLAHPDFEHPAVAVPMARIVRRFVGQWLTVFSRLENAADPRHAEALRLLSWLGFTLEPGKLRGPLGHPLVYFWKESALRGVSS